MYRTSLILASLLASTRGQEEGCSVCGDGQRIGTPEAVFAFPGQPSVPCGSLQDAGAAGLISLSQCPFFPSLIGVCECEPIAPVSPPTPTIVLFAPPTTNAPVASPVKSPIAPVYIDGVNNDDDGGGAPVHSPGSSPTYSPPEYRYSPEGSPMQTFRPAFFSPVNVFPSTVLTPNGASPMYVYDGDDDDDDGSPAGSPASSPVATYPPAMLSPVNFLPVLAPTRDDDTDKKGSKEGKMGTGGGEGIGGEMGKKRRLIRTLATN